MLKRIGILLACGLGLMTMAGCGHVAQTVGVHPTVHHSSPSPRHTAQPAEALVVGTTPTYTKLLVPTEVSAPTNNQTNETLHAHLIPGSGMDSLHVIFSSPTTGALTITTATGSVVWHKSHVGWAGVANFGSQHVPVILTESDQSFCGTGGCLFASYTYNSHRHTFVEIPIAPYANLTYRLNPNYGQWTAIPATSTSSGSVLGTASLTATGLQTTQRTYGPSNGFVGQSYQYTLDGSGSGEWVPIGGPRFGPDQLSPTTMGPSSSLTQTALVYLGEVMINHPQAADQMVSSSANAQQLWSRLASITTFGLGNLNSAQVQKVGSNTLIIPVSALLGTGLAEHLALEDVTIGAVITHSDWSINRVQAMPVPLTYRTITAVLKRLTKNSTVINWFTAHPKGAASISESPQQADAWQILLRDGSTQTTLNLSAKTGQIASSN